MTWTGPADLRQRVRRWWDRGSLLACLAGAEPLFPRRLPLKAPTSAEITRNFAEVRAWIEELDRHAKCYRIEWRTLQHRVLGANDLPDEVWIDTLDDALRFIGKSREAERFASLVAVTRERMPELVDWLKRRPLRALALADDWPRLLDIVQWMQEHPRPGNYLRQVDIPGVHTKFIEARRSVLAEWFDLVLPPEAVDSCAGGMSGFCRRYGFLDKPMRVRFRILDEACAILRVGTDQDVTVTYDAFAALDPVVETVFITENEVNFLAFPPTEKSMVVFGAGYGFDMLARARWLHDRRICYWGDIDTHGFAILDQLRGHFPHARSFLMDRNTLMAHRNLWGREPRQENRELTRLTPEESALYDDLRRNRLGDQVRLEQERVGFDRIRATVAELIGQMTACG
ncbi:MAG: DUF3322 domain-containing protein [Desulfobacterales bacterium]